MYVKQNKISEVNFLASSKFQNFTKMVSDEGIKANEKGHKIIPAGTVYRNDNGVAIGLLFNDVDVTNGPHECAVMYQGVVIGARLPKTVSDADKATMKGIMFKDDYDEQVGSVEYVVTTDTKYQASTVYYSKNAQNEFTKLVAGTDYTVGDDITGTVYVVKS